LEICAVEQVEAFRNHLKSGMFREANAAAQSQIERLEVEPLARVASNSYGAVVGARVKVAIPACDDVEG
jgi:hypothetical protein